MPSRYRRLSDLPDVFPVFPLSGATLFPRWQLPLNIFEPRYLNMIDDAMMGSRLIGMIQTLGGSRAEPILAKVGCAGRITSYSETDDGRYMITLTGIARYRITEELGVSTPYRQVRADFSAYGSDLAHAELAGLPTRDALEMALRAYADSNGFEADWDAVEEAPLETLIHALATGCPFRTIEKQALLEAPDLAERYDILIKLLTMNAADSGNQDEDGSLQ